MPPGPRTTAQDRAEARKTDGSRRNKSNNDFSVIGNPTAAQHYYNYLRGKITIGVDLRYGGDGLNGTTGAQPWPWMYDGDPATNTGWTEGSVSHVPGDRRGLISAGPYTLPVGGSRVFEIAYIFAQGPGGGSAPHLASVGSLQQAADQVLVRYQNGTGTDCSRARVHDGARFARAGRGALPRHPRRRRRPRAGSPAAGSDGRVNQGWISFKAKRGARSNSGAALCFSRGTTDYLSRHLAGPCHPRTDHARRPSRLKNGGQATQALGRTISGLTTKLHVVWNGQGLPLGMYRPAGPHQEVTRFAATCYDKFTDFSLNLVYVAAIKCPLNHLFSDRS